MKKKIAKNKLKDKSKYLDEDVLKALEQDIDARLEDEIKLQEGCLKKKIDQLQKVSIDLDTVKNMLLTRYNARMVKNNFLQAG
ncbi:hypothetical protein [Aquimarina intermedia]|uniref:Uncharacterized protein n=1 Tax=Aquimarina intermedia TaxID=350814 RepID=A0A5S5C4J6_9FLAO|nr:hypothetical protein [Aquimarina intermedia]TYP74237.1 hypothetical protein BD809_10455 [Aquimarina intermedia]